MTDDEITAQLLEYKLGRVWPYKVLSMVIEEAKLLERERCAKVAEDMRGAGNLAIADAIRAITGEP